ncbi:hypothetical protein [Pseudonocardia xishanensis]|uniref:Uncharacterized protein n=1 Tax=Pseudonocardia xishanensis TaxID=630995 RepID=A0ABP8S0F1_9PSEU
MAVAARDAGTPLAMQVLIYPMLDDRNTSADPHTAPFVGWTWDDNYTGWHALLGDDIGTAEVAPYAVPARISDYRGLPLQQEHELPRGHPPPPHPEIVTR